MSIQLETISRSEREMDIETDIDTDKQTHNKAYATQAISFLVQYKKAMIEILRYGGIHFLSNLFVYYS